MSDKEKKEILKKIMIEYSTFLANQIKNKENSKLEQKVFSKCNDKLLELIKKHDPNYRSAMIKGLGFITKIIRGK
jgi:hypothetical protein